MKIIKIQAQEIYDSRGIPTVGVKIELENGIYVYSAYPSGSSNGIHEAVDLRDGETRLEGKGVRRAVETVEKVIAPEIIGMDVEDQLSIDTKLIQLDGTNNKSHLGGNAVLGVSMGAAKAAAASKGIPLYKYLRLFFPNEKPVLPIPLLVLIEGGKHAEGSSDFQEYMIVPLKGKTFSQKMEMAAEVNYLLHDEVKTKGWATTVGQEGAFAGPVCFNEEPIEMLLSAIEKAGYKAGRDISIALDCAASEFYQDGRYFLKRDNKVVEAGELIGIYEEWVKKYPIFSIEDGLYEDDWGGFRLMTKKLGGKIQVVGDDLYTTNPKRLQKGINQKATNAVLIKLNQIGTVSETIDAIKMAQENDFQAVISQRAGETEDTFYADLCVASGCGQIKSGAPRRGERVAKYNRLLWIEKEMGEKS